MRLSRWTLEYRAAANVWSEPCALEIADDEQRLLVIQRRVRVRAARRRIAEYKVQRERERVQEIENMEKVKELWKFKTMRAGERAYRLWLAYRDGCRSEKQRAATFLQGIVRRNRAKKELARRKANERRLHALLARGLARKDSYHRPLKYFNALLSNAYHNKRERAAEVLTRFGRVVVAKRRLRQQRIVRRCLADGAQRLRNTAFRAWRTHAYKTKRMRAATHIQRRARGILARAYYKSERARAADEKRKIGLAFGSRSRRALAKCFGALAAHASENIRVRSATRIQGLWRARRARRQVQEEKNRAMRNGDVLGVAQRMRRERLLKLIWWAMRMGPSAARVQRAYRCRCARLHFEEARSQRESPSSPCIPDDIREIASLHLAPQLGVTDQCAAFPSS